MLLGHCFLTHSYGSFLTKRLPISLTIGNENPGRRDVGEELEMESVLLAETIRC